MSAAITTKMDTSPKRPSYKVVGVRVDALEMRDVLTQIQAWIASRSRGNYVAVTGMHGVSEVLRDPSLRQVINQAGMVVPDGMPLVWLARWHGISIRRRVTGADLMQAFCEQTGSRYRHFFYGGAPGVAEDLAQKLNQHFGIVVAGTYTPPFRPLTVQEEIEIAARVQDATPDVLWVGLSTPKQERWMYAHRLSLAVPVMLGVGAAFDMHSDRLTRAPVWVQDLGLEWFYRLLAEPRRLWRRYLVMIPTGVWSVMLELLHVVPMTRGWRWFALVMLLGVAVLALAYRFRLRIEHFHPRIRFRTLQTVTITPSEVEIPQGAHRRLAVVAHYRDGSTEESPANVQWVSSSLAVAQVSPEGIIVAESVGSAAVKAKLNNTIATVNVSVVPAVPVALAIFPTSETIPVGGTVQYKVIATSSDDSVADVTPAVKWDVSNPSAVELSSSGLARSKAAGRTVLSVELTTPLGAIETDGVLTATSSPHAFDGVFTYRYDDTGAGQNRLETLLTPKNVNAQTFGKLFAAPVDGYVYAQPLYVPNVSIQGLDARNVVYAATEHDTLFAFDADTGTELFHKSLGSAVPEKALPCKDMGPEIGITGTPVIDPGTKTMYVAAKVYENGASSFRLHALDIASGNEKPGSPVLISANVPGDGGGSHDGSVAFAATTQLQRPGLRIVNGQVILTFGSLCDRGDFHGWVFLYDASTLKQTAVFLTTPDGHHGGIWQAGAAPAVDSAGSIYLISGDGEFELNQQRANLGDTILKLRWNGVGTLAPSDYFTPYDQSEMDVNNGDLGSSGPIVLPDQLGQHAHLLFAAAKNGAIYVLNRDNMGHFQPTSNSQIVQYVPHFFADKVHASAGYWRNATGEWVYISSIEGTLQAVPLSHGRLSATPESETTMTFTYPGVTPVISSHGNDDGIVWALENYSGVLRAFSATDLAKELYNSRQAANDRDRAERGVQFYVPTVANGKVYFGSRGHLYAYGLMH